MIRGIMKKVKTFLHVFRQSLLPQPKYYRKILRADFSFSLKYFVTLIFLLNIVFFGLFFGGWLKKPYDHLSLKAVESALSSYPDNLTVEVMDGTLTTNYDHPYFLWGEDEGGPVLLAVVSETSTPEEISEFETPVMFTGTDLVFSDTGRGTVSNVLPYGGLNLTVDKASVDSLLVGLEKVKPFLLILSFLFALIIAPLLVTVGIFIYLVILSLFCYFVFSLYSKKNNFKNTLQLALHSATLPFLTKYTLLGFGYDLDRAWPVFALLVTVFIMASLYETYLDR